MVAIQVLHYEFMGPVRLDEWGPPMEDVVYIMLARGRDGFSPVYAAQCGRSDDAGFFTKNPGFKCWISQAGSEGNLYVAIRPMFGSSPRDREAVVGKIVSKYSPPCNAGEEAAGKGGGAGDPPRGSRGRADPGGGPLPFVDPGKDPRHYVRRYLEEEGYREWFHRNYPGRTIFDGVGVSEDEYRRMAGGLARPGGGPGAPAGAAKCACCGADMTLERELRRGCGLYRCSGCGISDTRLE